MRYRLFRRGTAHSVGHLAVIPEDEPGLEEAARILTERPMDEFLGKHLLETLVRLESREFAELCDSWTVPALKSVLCAAAWLSRDLSEFRGRFPDPAALAGASSTIFLRSCLLPDQAAHAEFCRRLGENILDHQPLPQIGECALPKVACQPRRRVDLAALAGGMAPAPAVASTPLAETIRRAAEALARVGVAAGREPRHEAALRPVGLMRPWQCRWRVRNGSLDYTVEGVQVAFGRGFEVEQARASYLMEMVERFSALPGVDGLAIDGLGAELLKARHSELKDALDPNALGLEVPYNDEAIHWIPGRSAHGTCFVPAQAVFPFINLDEPSLFSGLNTTGLGAGNTLAEARLSGLLEAVERDAEALGFHDPGRSFRVTSRDRQVRRYLRGLSAAGLDVLVQDLEHESGIPCYKAFVLGPGGEVAKGAAASLCGRRAVLSAITEIPYPLRGQRTRPGLADLPEAAVEELPEYGTGSAAGDLALAEAAVRAAGFEPVCVDLTREAVAIPVVRVLVPGFELVADFDRFSRLSGRMLGRYLEAVGQEFQ